MLKKIKLDGLDLMSLMNGLVFFAPVALLVRTQAGISTSTFFILQAILSIVVFAFEIPAGRLTDQIGYRNTIILSQMLLFISRILLLTGFVTKCLWVFIMEAIIEGIAACFASGTESAYLYSTMDEEQFVIKIAHVGNCGTVGFIISTIAYACIYKCTGIIGLLVATCITSCLGWFATLKIKKEDKISKELSTIKKKNYGKELFSKEAVLFVVILSCVSISFILINFFYVDKIITLKLSEELLTPIILGYSAVQLLSEKILEKISKRKYTFAFFITFAIAGILMLIFGVSSNTVVCLIIMLILPLSLDIPSIILDEIQNKFVDKIEMEEKRAELLSVFNMGVNLLEIIFLFCSAFLANMGVSMCFLLIGITIILVSILFYVVFRRSMFMAKESHIMR